MDLIDILGDVAHVLLRGFVVIAPLLAWQFVALWARPWRRREGGLGDPTIIAGMMVGIAMLAVILPLHALSWDSIVTVGGFWDLTLWQFVDMARSIMVHAPGDLFVALVADDAQRDLQTWLGLAVTLWLVRVIAIWLSDPLHRVNRLLIGEVATFLASVGGTVYLGPLLLWSINHLNFWLLLIAVLLIQDYRYDEPPLFGRLVGAVRANGYHHRRVPPEVLPVPDPD